MSAERDGGSGLIAMDEECNCNDIPTRDDEERPEDPAPEIKGYSVERCPHGSISAITVRVSCWFTDHREEIAVEFNVLNDVAHLTSYETPRSLVDVRRDLVPAFAAQQLLADRFPDLKKVEVMAVVDDAVQEASRAVTGGDGDE